MFRLANRQKVDIDDRSTKKPEVSEMGCIICLQISSPWRSPASQCGTGRDIRADAWPESTNGSVVVDSN